MRVPRRHIYEHVRELSEKLVAANFENGLLHEVYDKAKAENERLHEVIETYDAHIAQLLTEQRDCPPCPICGTTVGPS